MEVNKFIKGLIITSLVLVICVVIYGQFTGNTKLTSFGEGKVTMKFVTLYLFTLSLLSLITKKQIIAGFLIITSVYVYTSWFFNEAKPLFLPIFETGEVVRSLEGDIPSWMTLVAFIIFGFAEITKFRLLYKIVGLQAIVAFLGHLINEPVLFCYIEGFSTGQAVNTAILFMHLSSYRLLK